MVSENAQSILRDLPCAGLESYGAEDDIVRCNLASEEQSRNFFHPEQICSERLRPVDSFFRFASAATQLDIHISKSFPDTYVSLYRFLIRRTTRTPSIPQSTSPAAFQPILSQLSTCGRSQCRNSLAFGKIPSFSSSSNVSSNASQVSLYPVQPSFLALLMLTTHE